jgi:Tfp pilus assembly protein PilO
MILDEKAKKTLTVGIVLAIVITGVVSWGHFYILKPYYLRNDAMKKTLNEEIKKLKDSLRDIIEVEKSQPIIAEMHKVVEEASWRLPSSPDAPGFFQELIRILRITGVQARRVDPLERRGSVLYTEIPYKIEGQCRYHEFGQFLNLIEENQNRFMRVKSFSIGNNENRPSIHPVTVNIGTFMFNKALKQ